MHESMRLLLEHARQATKGAKAPVITIADLRLQMDVTSAVMTNWNTRGISKEGAIKAEAMFGIPASRLRPDLVMLDAKGKPYSSIEPMPARVTEDEGQYGANEGFVTGSLAHPLIHTPDTVPRLTREQLMAMEEVRGEFWIDLWDDAMAPHLPAGRKVKFTAAREPQFGNLVLLRDARGGWHVREYRQSMQHGWIGVPSNEAFEQINGSTKGLIVAAVLSGLDGPQWKFA